MTATTSADLGAEDSSLPFGGPARAISPISPSVRLATVGLLLVLQAAHLFTDSFAWTIDTEWAISQRLFSLTFFGPLTAGLAGLYGRQLRRTAWLHRLHPLRSMFRYLGELWAMAGAVFLAGIAAAVVLSMQLTAAPLVVGRMPVDIGVGLVVLAAYVVAGAGIGMVWPSFLAPPLAGLSAFALTFVAIMGGLPALVRFGGASGSLVGLQTAAPVQAVRVVFYLSVLVAVVAGSLQFLRNKRVHLRVVAAGCVVGLVSLLYAGSLDGPLEQVPVSKWSCQQGDPEICVPSRFERFGDDIMALSERNGVAEALVAAAPEKIPGKWYFEDASGFFLVSRAVSGSEDAVRAAEEYMILASDRLTASQCLVEFIGGVKVEPQLSDQEQVADGNLLSWRSVLTTEYPDSAYPHIPRHPVGSPELSQWLRDQLDVLPPCPDDAPPA